MSRSTVKDVAGLCMLAAIAAGTGALVARTDHDPSPLQPFSYEDGVCAGIRSGHDLDPDQPVAVKVRRPGTLSAYFRCAPAQPGKALPPVDREVETQSE
jgi:hypothetical protein